MRLHHGKPHENDRGRLIATVNRKPPETLRIQGDCISDSADVTSSFFKQRLPASWVAILLTLTSVFSLAQPTSGASGGVARADRNHIRLFITGGRSPQFLAEHYDVFVWGNLEAKRLYPEGLNLLYEYFGTMVASEANRKYAALVDYAAAHGLSDDNIEEMFLHAKNDVDYSLGEPTELDPRVTKTVPGWDPVNDVDGDGQVDDTEFANRINPQASARTKDEARIPIYYWGPPTDYIMNIGNAHYTAFVLEYAYDLIVNNPEYDAPWGWQISESVSLVPEAFSGSLACLIDESRTGVNLINQQYVQLTPGATYTIGAMIKTGSLSGFIRVYEYEFDGSQRLNGNIQVDTPNSDWQFHYLQFQVATDAYGRVTFRFNGGPGTVWLDDIFLVEGAYDNYANVTAEANLVDNGGFEAAQTVRYDGFMLDTLRDQPATQGATVLLEYPDVAVYSTDIRTFLTSLMATLPPGAYVAGNGWYADPLIITASYIEGWARITTSISPAKLDETVARDESGIEQMIQFNPIYHEVANPDRPDLLVEGVSLERDQLYSLALYYLVHGSGTYYGYGVHGGYMLDEEKWFDAVDYDVGAPLGSYYVLDERDPSYTTVTPNLLVNGDFETDDDLDGNPDSWLPAEPVELDPVVKYEGMYSAKIDAVSEVNNINKQYVVLQPNTAYTLSGWIKTEDVTGAGAQIYPYEFDDCAECGSAYWIVVLGTTDWTFYNMSFQTGSDAQGRINFRIVYGTGRAWFDNLHLTEGRYEDFMVYGRDFEHARIVVKTPHRASDETTSHALDGRYHPLHADGTLGPARESVSLLAGEGAIMIHESALTIPAVSTWGMMAMALIVLVAGVVMLRYRIARQE